MGVLWCGMLPAEFCSIVDGATVVMGGIDGGGGIGYPPDAILKDTIFTSPLDKGGTHAI